MELGELLQMAPQYLQAYPQYLQMEPQYLQMEPQYLQAWRPSGDKPQPIPKKLRLIHLD
jgi:hypothetical protein